ncbi:MAG: hypothetical protein RLZZ324_278 [Candidatus Parcubacteria bacterium]|jgi:hypothetical protein
MRTVSVVFVLVSALFSVPAFAEEPGTKIVTPVPARAADAGLDFRPLKSRLTDYPKASEHEAAKDGPVVTTKNAKRPATKAQAAKVQKTKK